MYLLIIMVFLNRKASIFPKKVGGWDTHSMQRRLWVYTNQVQLWTVSDHRYLGSYVTVDNHNFGIANNFFSLEAEGRFRSKVSQRISLTLYESYESECLRFAISMLASAFLLKALHVKAITKLLSWIVKILRSGDNTYTWVYWTSIWHHRGPVGQCMAWQQANII